MPATRITFGDLLSPRRLRERIGAWRLFQRCPVLLPSFRFARGHDPLSVLLRLSMRLERRDSFGSSPVQGALAVLFWLVVSAQQVIKHGWANRRLARTDPTAPGTCRQLAGMLRALFRDNIGPHSYYQFRLYRPSNWATRGGWFQDWQSYPLLLELDRAMPGPVAAANDKLSFWRRCVAEGLPTVPLLAAFDRGRCVAPDPAPDTLPPCDLVLKPSDAYGGFDIDFLFHQAATGLWADGAATFTAAEVFARTAALSAKRAILIQPRLANHPGLDGLSNGFLITLRIVTARFPGQPPFLLCAACRMPTGEGRVANIGGRPLIAAIDPATGILAPSETYTHADGIRNTHPDTGAAVAGFRLPLWEETRALSLRAHALFEEFPFVGWDIVLTPEGALLLEFNTTWGTFIVQTGGGGPLGSTVFPECYLAAFRTLYPDAAPPA